MMDSQQKWLVLGDWRTILIGAAVLRCDVFFFRLGDESRAGLRVFVCVNQLTRSEWLLRHGCTGFVKIYVVRYFGSVPGGTV